MQENQPQQTPQPQVPQQPPVQPAPVPTPAVSKPNNMIVVILTILVVILLGSTAYLYYQNQQLTRTVNNYQKQTPSPTPTSTPDSTANWKTYINDKYAFSFRYKPDGNLTEGSNPNQLLLVKIIYANETLELFIQDNQNLLPLDQYIQQYGGDYPGPSEGSIENGKTIGNITGTYILFPKATKGQFDTSGVSQHFYFTKEKTVYWFRLSQIKDTLTDDDKAYFNQILSTFKFTNQSASKI